MHSSPLILPPAPYLVPTALAVPALFTGALQIDATSPLHAPGPVAASGFTAESSPVDEGAAFLNDVLADLGVADGIGPTS